MLWWKFAQQNVEENSNRGESSIAILNLEELIEQHNKDNPTLHIPLNEINSDLPEFLEARSGWKYNSGKGRNMFINELPMNVQFDK